MTQFEMTPLGLVAVSQDRHQLVVEDGGVLASFEHRIEGFDISPDGAQIAVALAMTEGVDLFVAVLESPNEMGGRQ